MVDAASLLPAHSFMPVTPSPTAAHTAPIPTESQTVGRMVVLLVAVTAFVLYAMTAAPSITWAHYGADSGELLAAAMVNGVPHPPGYPLYTVLLRNWLQLLAVLIPGSDLAWRGNLLSALLASMSVGITAAVAAHLLAGRPYRWLWVGLTAGAWMITPLLWGQAVITEVYTLHAVALALLGWAVINRPDQPWLLAPVTALGIANHLTILFVLPAVLFLSWSRSADDRARRWSVAALVLGILAGALVYLRTVFAAAVQPPPPVNWGYADNADGFWWLISGQAYRSYLFGVPRELLFGRITVWANVLVSQLTAVGLAVALCGLAFWDQRKPRLRTFALLWMLPTSLYSIVYYTRDSEIYLLSVCWLSALLFGVGLERIAVWLNMRRRLKTDRAALWVAGVTLAGLIGLLLFRYPTLSLHSDDGATRYLAQAIEIIEPHSLVVTSRDFETFALWYGAWGSGKLLESAPDTVLVNHALYQFDWYRRLLVALYPDVPAVGQSTEALVAANRTLRPIYFTEKFSFVPEEALQPAGPLWRYHPQE